MSISDQEHEPCEILLPDGPALPATPNRTWSLSDKPVAVLSRDMSSPTDESESDAVNALDRKGVCLRISGQDLLIMMRGFLCSHMHVLKREP